MSLLTKKGPWIAATLIAAASVFAQNNNRKDQKDQKMMDQGHEMMPGQMMAGYNAPARIDVRGAWDFYFSGTFTYWQASQENMELGIANTATTGYAINGNVVQQNFKFKPGFKVMGGMNFDHDNWSSDLEYTWYRGTDSVSSTQDAAGTASYLLPMQGHPTITNTPTGNITAGAARYTSGRSSWRLSMDLLDWNLSRCEYVGMKLAFKPFFGARAAFIRQKLSTSYTTPTATGGGILSISDKTSSWALGPRAGLYSSWMIGQGFRFYGVGSGDILYTRYTTLSFNESATNLAGTAETTIAWSVKEKNLGYVRTHLELELGFGWGMYFDNHNWHVDLALGYTFQAFFNQNMFRHYTSAATAGSPILGYSQSPNGDLFVQGLTANLRFDF